MSIHLFSIGSLLLIACVAPLSSSFGTQRVEFRSLISETSARWLPFGEALERAQRRNKKVLVFVDAPWCGWCKRMENEIFQNEELQIRIKDHYELTRIGFNDSETHHRYEGYRLSSMELARKLGATTTPATIFLDTEGRVIATFSSYVDPGLYLDLLGFIGSDAYRSQSLEDFVREND